MEAQEVLVKIEQKFILCMRCIASIGTMIVLDEWMLLQMNMIQAVLGGFMP